MARDFTALRQELIAETKKKIAASVDSDQLIIQAVTTLEQLEQAANRLAKKGREWYGLENPEYERAVKEHEEFVAKAAEKEAQPDSMGASLAPEDTTAIATFLKSVSILYDERDRLLAYLDTLLIKRCPNMQELAGTKIAAQLLSHAGSLQKLAAIPSSTLQLYGAETALFRHLRDKRRHRSPKYGLIFNHQLIQKTPPRDRGKAARALADKLSLCARLDAFGGERKAHEYKEALSKRFTAW